jgi:1-phosphofructokinase family hexose kinase
MIVSVTVNTTLDQVLFVPTFALNTTIRATGTVQGLGGKPTDASWILGELGTPSLALGFAAGAIGGKVESLLRERGVTVDFIPVLGDTRINTIIIVGDGSGQATITTSTLEVCPEHLDTMREKYRAALETATCVVLGGTVPKGCDPSFYVELIGMAHERGIPTVFDADEPNLSIGLTARPTVIKPNQDELSRLVKRPIITLDDAYAAGREIVEQYGTIPVITLGADGALAVLPDRAWFVPAIQVDVVSTAGCGDGVLAGLTFALANGQPIEDGIRLGIAAATAVLLQPGTADCRKEDVERFLPMVDLRDFQPSSAQGAD